MIFMYSGFPNVLAPKRQKNAKFPKVLDLKVVWSHFINLYSRKTTFPKVLAVSKSFCVNAITFGNRQNFWKLRFSQLIVYRGYAKFCVVTFRTVPHRFHIFSVPPERQFMRNRSQRQNFWKIDVFWPVGKTFGNALHPPCLFFCIIDLKVQAKKGRNAKKSRKCTFDFKIHAKKKAKM